LPFGRIPGKRRCFHFHTPKICDHLPDLSILHFDADAFDGSRHVCPWNAVTDGAEQFGAGTAMSLLRPCQIGAASAALSSQPVAQRAVDAKVRLAGLGGLGFVSERIALLRAERGGEGGQNQFVHRATAPQIGAGVGIRGVHCEALFDLALRRAAPAHDRPSINDLIAACDVVSVVVVRAVVEHRAVDFYAVAQLDVLVGIFPGE
jgi:hypothetical protein